LLPSLIGAGDRVKVLDFGLAKLRDVADASAAATMPTRELTGEGKIVGTVAYMSPEQAEGSPSTNAPTSFTRRHSLRDVDGRAAVRR
jgi:serine/threonine protein kinase